MFCTHGYFFEFKTNMNKPHALTVPHCYVCAKYTLVRAACCWGWLNCREPPASSSAPPSPAAAASPTAPPPAAAAFPFNSLPCPGLDPDYFTAGKWCRRPEEGTPGTPARELPVLDGRFPAALAQRQR